MNLKYKDNRSYLDGVVFDLINFLHLKGDSKEDFEFWWSDLGPFDTTQLFSLFDNNQYLRTWDVNGDFFANYLIIKDYNKLLKIVFSIKGPEDDKTFIKFSLYSDVEDVFVETLPLNEEKSIVRVINTGNTDISSVTESIKKVDEPGKVPITSLLRPVSISQITRRGLKPMNQRVVEGGPKLRKKPNPNMDI